MRRWLAALFLAVGRALALIGKPLGECAAETLGRRIGVVGIVARALAGAEHAERMVQIVVPLRGVEALAQQMRLVPVVLEHEMDRALAREPRAHCLGDLAQDRALAVVADGVDSVEAQPVEMKLLEPVERVLDVEFAHRLRRLAVKIDRRAPRRVVALGEEMLRVDVEVVPLRPEMVVDDVEEHGEVARMTGVDEALQILGPAVAAVGREDQHAVIAPIPLAGKIRYRHQLDGGDAEAHQVVEVTLDAGEIAARGEGAGMELVEHDLLPAPAAPVGIAPVIAARIDDLARPVHVLGLVARGRVWHRLAIDNVAVAAAGAGRRGGQLEPAVARARHRQLAGVLEPQRHRLRLGRPQAEAHALADQLGAERQLTVASHPRPRQGRARPGAAPAPQEARRAAPRGG